MSKMIEATTGRVTGLGSYIGSSSGLTYLRDGNANMQLQLFCMTSWHASMALARNCDISLCIEN